jgi:hypothetical protein
MSASAAVSVESSPFAPFMSQTRRMVLVELLPLAYASVSYFAFARLSRRMLAWMPGRTVEDGGTT